MPNADIVIVEPNERFTFLPLLYEYLGGYADLDEIAPTYDFLLSSQANDKKNVSMKRASALSVDPDKQDTDGSKCGIWRKGEYIV